MVVTKRAQSVGLLKGAANGPLNPPALGDFISGPAEGRGAGGGRAGLRLRGLPLCAAAAILLLANSCVSAKVAPLKLRQAHADGKHYVFAHYMTTLFAFGNNVDSYEREIRLAMDAGIDGFALNCGAWSAEPRYKRRAQMIYDAADRLGGRFKLFFSADMAGKHLTPDDIRDMVTTFGKRPSQFTQDGRIVLSTYIGDEQPPEWWRDQVLQPLASSGYPVFFVPHLRPIPRSELPTYEGIKRTLDQWAPIIDGAFYFGAAGQPAQLAASNAAWVRAAHEAGKIFMASVTPAYWQHRRRPYRYFADKGGEGLEQQWESIIKTQPDWVEIVTWNDYTESTYIFPEGADIHPNYATYPIKDHSGYYELCKRFIQWFKTGRQPEIQRDSLYFFYRQQPRNQAEDSQDTIRGDVQDVIHITARLTAPAQLLVQSGRTQTHKDLPAGVSSVTAPFSPGRQHFELVRDGRKILEKDGPAIREVNGPLDYDPVSGFAHSR